MKKLITPLLANKIEAITTRLGAKKNNFLAISFFLFIPLSNLLAQNPNPNVALDNTIQNEMTEARFPGASTIIVKDGKIVWIASYGYADLANAIPVEDTTVFLLASMSKVFTATAAMQLYESGNINLDADINNYLPFPIVIPNFTNDSITLRQLMTHTASIEDNAAPMGTYYGYPDPTISLADCIQRYFSSGGSDYSATANFSNNPPGTDFNYSNMGTALSGYLTEVTSGMPFSEFCAINIFDPLCMQKTAWHFADFNPNHVAKPYAYQGGNYVAYPHYGFADYPDGQLRSTAKDIGNFMIAYLNGGSFANNSILSAASIHEMWSSQIQTLDPTQGLNWYQANFGTTPLWGHNGGEDGVSTALYVDPTNRIGICVLTNGEGDAFTICQELYQYALTLNSEPGSAPNCNNNVGIAALNNSEEMNIFPNPSNNYLIITNPGFPIHKIDITDLTGKSVAQFTTNTNKIDIGNIPPSIYFIKIIGEEKTITKKFIKQ
jgi:CubicO group peptidase (beta-lactamase class C family)